MPSVQRRSPAPGTTESPAEVPVMENVAPVEQPVKVALLLPLSGRLASLGKAMADAAQMALFDLADLRFQLLPLDDKGTAAGSVAAANDAIAQGAQMIIGPLLGASVSAVAPIAQAAGVPVVAFSSDRKVAAPGVYIIGFTPDAEVQRVVDFAALGGLTRFALAAPNNLYGNAVAAAMRRAVADNRGNLVRVQLYDPATQDFAPPVRKLLGLPEPAPPAPAAAPAPSGQPAASPAAPPLPPIPPIPPVPTLTPPSRPFDALLLAEGGAQLRALAAALATAGMPVPAVQLLGTGKWDEPNISSEPALIGAWFAAPSPASRDEFEIQFKRTFGQNPPRLATLAYDATALAAVLARGPQQQPFTAAALTDPSGFYGRDGLFRLTADGLAERRLAILRVDRDGVTVIDEPPRSFAAGS
ncbi:MAG: penicillin-binding protein activator [Rhodospirillales bacterium]